MASGDVLFMLCSGNLIFILDDTRYVIYEFDCDESGLEFGTRIHLRVGTVLNVRASSRLVQAVIV